MRAARCQLRSAFSLSVLFGAALIGCTAPDPIPSSESRAVATPEIRAAVPVAWPYPLDAPAAAAANGMVVADAPLATRVGVETLAQGGTAVDAAIATAFALAVVLPSAGNVGGGGFAVAAIGGTRIALDFREVAPAAATRDMYLDSSGQVTLASREGPLAVAVPGTVAGLAELHRRFGTRSWQALLAPAIELAERGFVVDDVMARILAADADRLARYPGSSQLYLRAGKPLRTGTHWRNPELGQTLRAIATAGADSFYRGVIADLIVAEMEAGGGLLTHADLAAYAPVWREPLTLEYRGFEIVTMPPPSSGGVALALIAGQLEQYDLGALGWHSAAALHVQAEAMRRAFAIRNTALGDPDFAPLSIDSLTDVSRVHELGRSISMRQATPSSRVSATLDAPRESRHTTHLSVADRHGDVVALTTTINGWHGSAVTVRGAGFLLNNEMDDFTTKAGVPDQYGLVTGAANAIEPGKRMLSSMTPTLMFDAEGSAVLVTGASGGSHIISAVFQQISHHVDYGLGPAASMSAPRLHHQHLPDRIGLESDGFLPATAAALKALGHQVHWFDSFEEGSVAATIERHGGRWYGVADPRIGGLAAGH